jgi:hypothetical protein
MASSLLSPGLRYAANKMILELRREITKVSQFTTNFTADAAQKGSTMLVPVLSDAEAGEYNRTSNNYGTVNGSIRYIPMTFNSHPKHSFGFTENDFNLVNGTGFWENAGIASARAVSRKIASTVAKLINKTNIPTSGYDTTKFYDADGDEIVPTDDQKAAFFPTFSSANEVVIGTSQLTKATVAGFRAACDAANIPAGDTVLALTPAKFAELLAILDANMYGGTEAIRAGIIPFLYGYKAIIEMTELGGDGENLAGALIPATSIAIASRVLEIQNPKLYEEVGTTTDDKSELTIQFRRGGDWTTGDSVATAECLLGAKLIQPTRIVRLVTEATSGGPTGATGETGPTGEG